MRRYCPVSTIPCTRLSHSPGFLKYKNLHYICTIYFIQYSRLHAGKCCAVRAVQVLGNLHRLARRHLRNTNLVGVDKYRINVQAISAYCTNALTASSLHAPSRPRTGPGHHRDCGSWPACDRGQPRPGGVLHRGAVRPRRRSTEAPFDRGAVRPRRRSTEAPFDRGAVRPGEGGLLFVSGPCGVRRDPAAPMIVHGYIPYQGSSRAR